MARWFRRLAYLFRRRQMDADLREEMEFHRARVGAPAFGNTTLAEEDARSIWNAGRLERLASLLNNSNRKRQTRANDSRPNRGREGDRCWSVAPMRRGGAGR